MEMTLTLDRPAQTLAPGAHGPGLLRRLAIWMRHRRTLAELATADARTCRDLGLTPPAIDGLVQAFGIDPTPVWGIGGVVEPVAAASRRP